MVSAKPGTNLTPMTCRASFAVVVVPYSVGLDPAVEVALLRDASGPRGPEAAGVRALCC